MNYKILFLSAIVIAALTSCSTGELSTYDFPGGAEYASPDYSVSIEQNGRSYNSLCIYSYALEEEYMKYYSWDRKIYQRQVRLLRTDQWHSIPLHIFFQW
jgi:hypothetical protein